MITIDLFPYDTPASDGSVIPLSIIMEYLKTDTHKQREENNLMLASVTHIDRKPDGPAKNLIGTDDKLLIKKSIVGYFKNLRPSNGFIQADFITLDPVNFKDNPRLIDDAIYVEGLLRSKIKLPISVVITAKWDAKKYCTKLDLINGGDFTLNPAFVKSGVRVASFSCVNSEESSILNFVPINDVEVFSSNISPTTLKDRLKFETLTPLAALNTLILSYKNFYKQNIKSLKPEEIVSMKRLLSSDIMSAIKRSSLDTLQTIVNVNFQIPNQREVRKSWLAFITAYRNFARKQSTSRLFPGLEFKLASDKFDIFMKDLVKNLFPDVTAKNI